MGLQGKALPPFELEGSDGQPHRQADYLGRWLLLFFYPKDNTSG